MARTQSVASDPGRSRVEAAFADEQLRSMRLVSYLMVPMLLVIATWVIIENGFPDSLFILPFLGVLACLLVWPYRLQVAGRLRPWHRFLFPALYVGLVTMVAMIPNPLAHGRLPLPVRLHFANEVYFFCLLAGALFTYSPRDVLWTGFVAVAIWSLAHVIVLASPGAYYTPGSAWEAMSEPERWRVIADPYRVNVSNWVRHVVALSVTTSILAAFVWRSRWMVYRQAQVERERANLSRYFSGNLVDELASKDEPLGPTRSQSVAVLFADIAGFTRMSEGKSPPEVIALLREFHGRMERAVFEQEGTIDKYIGDAVMATFGTPQARADDALRALRCARAMVASMAQWNEERARRGEEVVEMGVGVHYGPVVMGDIGGAHRLEFAVIGDTVNVASRLEHLTRELEARVVISGDVVAALPGGDAAHAVELREFRRDGLRPLRGRSGEVEVWLWSRRADV